MPDRKLVVIGDGPDMLALQAQAAPNIEILGRQSDAVMNDYMRWAKAFVFAAEEDFGIVPLEAQACGKPGIAYSRGGSLETISGFDGPEIGRASGRERGGRYGLISVVAVTKKK